jgi:hypothetical protein
MERLSIGDLARATGLTVRAPRRLGLPLARIRGYLAATRPSSCGCSRSTAPTSRTGSAPPAGADDLSFEAVAG